MTGLIAPYLAYIQQDRRFRDDAIAFENIIEAGAGRVVTTNTIPHVTNATDVAALLAEDVRAVRKLASPGVAARAVLRLVLGRVR